MVSCYHFGCFSSHLVVPDCFRSMSVVSVIFRRICLLSVLGYFVWFGPFATVGGSPVSVICVLFWSFRAITVQPGLSGPRLSGTLNQPALRIFPGLTGLMIIRRFFNYPAHMILVNYNKQSQEESPRQRNKLQFSIVSCFF